MIREQLYTIDHFVKEALRPCQEDSWGFGSDADLTNNGVKGQNPVIEFQIDLFALCDTA